MSRIQHIRCLAGALAGLAGALLAFAMAAPAALASTSPGRTRPLSWADPPVPPGRGAGSVPVYQVPARTAVTGGLPGWQIALIAAAAALAVATVLVLDRAGRAPHHAPGGGPGGALRVSQAISGPAGPGRPRARRAPAGPETPAQRRR